MFNCCNRGEHGDGLWSVVFHGQGQSCFSLLVPDIGIGVGLKENAEAVIGTQPGCVVKGRTCAGVHSIDVCTVADEGFHCGHVTGFCSVDERRLKGKPSGVHIGMVLYKMGQREDEMMNSTINVRIDNLCQIKGAGIPRENIVEMLYGIELGLGRLGCGSETQHKGTWRRSPITSSPHCLNDA